MSTREASDGSESNDVSDAEYREEMHELQQRQTELIEELSAEFLDEDEEASNDD